MGTIVKLSKLAKKQLLTVPDYIRSKLKLWTESVETDGIYEVRKIPGYHDETLKGKRFGQRSIRLNKAYRAIYVIKSGEIEFVSIEEVNKHDY